MSPPWDNSGELSVNMVLTYAFTGGVWSSSTVSLYHRQNDQLWYLKSQVCHCRWLLSLCNSFWQFKISQGYWCQTVRHLSLAVIKDFSNLWCWGQLEIRGLHKWKQFSVIYMGGKEGTVGIRCIQPLYFFPLTSIVNKSCNIECCVNKMLQIIKKCDVF